MRMQSGFTMVELVIVIIILGVLAATALPRFMTVTEDAHEVAVAGAGGSFGSSVSLAHAQWVFNSASGGTGAVDDLSGFGAGNIDTNTAGYPVAIDGDNTVVDVDDCVDVWNNIMTNPPTVSSATGSDYQATVSGQECTYTYQSVAGMSIVYDASNGTVTVDSAI